MIPRPSLRKGLNSRAHDALGRRALKFAVTGDFYSSPAWLALRYDALCRSDGRCCSCGKSAADGVIIEVDHIKPRSLYPALELEPTNLQVMCRPCNGGKSNRDQTDWRRK